MIDRCPWHLRALPVDDFAMAPIWGRRSLQAGDFLKTAVTSGDGKDFCMTFQWYRVVEPLPGGRYSVRAIVPGASLSTGDITEISADLVIDYLRADDTRKFLRKDLGRMEGNS